MPPSAVEDFVRAVEDGLILSKRLGAAAAPGAAPRHLGPMDRGSEMVGHLLPTAPMAYAVIYDPAIVDNPDVPSYQPHVYGRCDPPALIPLQMKDLELEVESLLGVTAFVTVRGRWWVHCVARNRRCACRFVIPFGDQGSILGVEVSIGRRSYASQVIDMEDQDMEQTIKTECGGMLKPQMFFFTINQIDGGSDIFATIKWTQNLSYQNGLFSVNILFNFPHYVNPSTNIFVKREKILLSVNGGTGKEILLQKASHTFKEKCRQGDKLSFIYEAAVESWSRKDFFFTYSVYSGNISGSILIQSLPSHDSSQREMFALCLHPGSNQNKKIFKKAVVFVVDISASMLGLPLENIKKVLSGILLELVHEDCFNIIAFNDELQSFSPFLVQATEETVKSATQWMDIHFIANGGTDIIHSLNEAVALLSGTQGSLPHIFIITDGSVEDERAICSTMILRTASSKSMSPRISTFGLGSYCNHHFLRMLASICKGHYCGAFDSDSIETQIGKWFTQASNVIVADITVDGFNTLDEFEVHPRNIPDVFLEGPLYVSGTFQGKLPHSLKVKGYLSDMSEIIVDLKVERVDDVSLEKIFAKQRIDLLTAQAWFSESKQYEKKVTKLSIQSGIPSEYTSMILVQSNPENQVAAPQKKSNKNRILGKNAFREDLSPMLFQNLVLGFGDVDATKDNLPMNFGEQKKPELPAVISKAVGCCGSVADVCCCMCVIKTCSKINDRCFIALTQLCTGLSCLACCGCCSDLCCDEN